MRKGVIDLDWLDSFIADRHFVNLVVSEDLTDSIKLLDEVRSKCTPIEEPQLGTIKENDLNTEFIGIREPLYKLVEQDPNEGMFFPKNENVTFTAKEFLSKTCTNNWEDKKFCENTGKCELCKIKQ